ncbi:MAG: tyrosine-protein phosphatase [Cyclobacteriaceae bacterium]
MADWPVDVHSHLIPGVDDGAKSPEDALAILRSLRDLGMKKWITTPHIFYEYYRNDPQTLQNGFQILQEYLSAQQEQFDISFAAEYYLDEHLFKTVDERSALTFGENFLLFETTMLSEPLDLDEFIFKAGLNGYRLVLAHPERYAYLIGNFKRLEELRDKGVYLQVNMLSFLGHYSPATKKMVRDMVELKLIDFIGSDCHHVHHAQLFSELNSDRYFRKALSSNLLNYTL